MGPDPSRGALWEAYLAGHTLEARNRLVESYRALAVSIAKGFKARSAGSGGSAGLELDDLVSSAQEGMIRAVESYDPNRGVPFEAYARLRVSGHIRDALRNEDHLSRRDRRTVRAYFDGESLEEGKVRRAVRLVAQRPGRGDTDDAARAVPGDDDIEGSVLTRVHVEGMLKALDPVEAAVLECRYLRGMSLSAIGATLALTESRVSQIHRVALQKLRVSALGAAGTEAAAG